MFINNVKPVISLVWYCMYCMHYASQIVPAVPCYPFFPLKSFNEDEISNQWKTFVTLVMFFFFILDLVYSLYSV